MKKECHAGKGVLVRNSTRKSLDQCFKGSSVVKRNGPNIMIRQEKGENKTVEKWLHLNRCKQYIPGYIGPYTLPIDQNSY